MGIQGNFCCMSHFTNVWNTHFKHVVIPKNHRFSECETCAHLNTILKGKINFNATDDTDENRLVKYREKVFNNLSSMRSVYLLLNPYCVVIAN